MEQQFKVGDLVRIQSGSFGSVAEAFVDGISHAHPKGLFQIVARLPEVDGQAQYRVRGDEPCERLVRESQLIPATRIPQPRR
jgi:hypothetical protein